MTNNELETGTVIAGTLRPEDLIPAFTAELEQRDFERAAAIARYRKVEYIALAAGYPIEPSIYADFLIEDLIDALNDVAPEGYYFGAHPGDGSDFGYWRVDMIDYTDDDDMRVHAPRDDQMDTYANKED